VILGMILVSCILGMVLVSCDPRNDIGDLRS